MPPFVAFRITCILESAVLYNTPGLEAWQELWQNFCWAQQYMPCCHACFYVSKGWGRHFAWVGHMCSVSCVLQQVLLAVSWPWFTSWLCLHCIRARFTFPHHWTYQAPSTLHSELTQACPTTMVSMCALAGSSSFAPSQAFVTYSPMLTCHVCLWGHCPRGWHKAARNCQVYI
jgi:hypothetical protein